MARCCSPYKSLLRAEGFSSGASDSLPQTLAFDMGGEVQMPRTGETVNGKPRWRSADLGDPGDYFDVVCNGTNYVLRRYLADVLQQSNTGPLCTASPVGDYDGINVYEP